MIDNSDSFKSILLESLKEEWSWFFTQVDIKALPETPHPLGLE